MRHRLSLVAALAALAGCGDGSATEMASSCRAPSWRRAIRFRRCWRRTTDILGLFAIVEQAAQDADDFETEFDATYGFPAVISIDWAENYVDDEVVYRTDAFAVTP